uniref:Uncharacterized protein n=1 Tax=viral metagenome TaxID=1070528 RepID=A0A6C0KIG0_9ZZZZ
MAGKRVSPMAILERHEIRLTNIEHHLKEGLSNNTTKSDESKENNKNEKSVTFVEKKQDQEKEKEQEKTNENVENLKNGLTMTENAIKDFHTVIKELNDKVARNEKLILELTLELLRFKTAVEEKEKITLDIEEKSTQIEPINKEETNDVEETSEEET